MTTIKVLQRKAKPSSLHFQQAPTKQSSIVDIGIKSGFENMLSTRKSPTGNPLTIFEKIKEFISRNKPYINIDWGRLRDVVSRLKIPILGVLGIAFISGVAYLSYKLYQHYTEKNKNETINKIMHDFEETSPDLFNVPGWRESILKEVQDAVNSGNESIMTEKIVKIKEKIIDHQSNINHKNMGSGIDLFI